jgi:hypothetical protein
MNRREELQIWRESTTIFMTAGHGGCDSVLAGPLQAERRIGTGGGMTLRYLVCEVFSFH